MNKILFRILLFGFGLAMKLVFKIASLKDAGFKKRLLDKTFLMQIKIEDENTGRFYKLEKGRITSKGKISTEAAGLLIEWQDSSTALKTLMKIKPEKLIHSLNKAVKSGKLAVEMEFAPTFSFLESVKEMVGIYPGLLPLLLKIPYVNKRGA